MIGRYKTLGMSRVLSEINKAKTWLKVELAITEANEELKAIPVDTTAEIRDRISLNGSISKVVKRAGQLEKTSGHDVQAFVDSLRELLPESLRRYLHEHTTSTDTTENALNLIVIQAVGVILKATDELAIAVFNLAVKYMMLAKIGRTHTQHGAPSTVGLYFLGWYDALERRRRLLATAMEGLRIGKVRGLVGTYDKHVTPQLEALALKKLGLTPVRVCYQIILRDRLADVFNNLAVLAALLENMAVNIRLGAQTEVGEFSEPFKKGRKGSTHSPHKKNTDKDENVTGLSRIIRNAADVELENIVTWWERDISHSSAERIIIEDAFHGLHFSLKRMIGIVTGLVVYEDQVTKNLNLTQGVIYSSEVKGLLMENGMEPDAAYMLTQSLSQQAWDERRSFLELLLISPEIPEELKSGRIQECFDLDQKLQYVPTIFAKFTP